MLELLRSSCLLYIRVILITCNLIIYLALYGALKSVDYQVINTSDTLFRDLRDDGSVIEEKQIKYGLRIQKITKNGYSASKVIGNSETDQSVASFGQGYAQADDNLWDLELMRRQAYGTLAEIYGNEESVQHDMLVRTLELKSLAEQALQGLEEPYRTNLDMFASGINEAAQDQIMLPINFYTHGLEGHFSPWKAIDTLVVLKMRHFEMSKPAISDKLLRFDLLNSSLDSGWVID